MKECIILAGGLGTRLRQVVSDVPKCMAEVAGHPFLFYLLNWCKKESFGRVILSVGYLSEIVIDWVENNDFPFDIIFVKEEEALGTGGAIKLAMNSIVTDRAIVINGDTFFNVDIDKLYTFHAQKNSVITLVLKPMNDFDRYGSVELNTEDRILAFREKQFCESGIINGGVYLIEKSVLSTDAWPIKFSFEKEVLESHLSDFPIYGNVQDSYFIDIGIPEDYKKANIDFKDWQKL